MHDDSNEALLTWWRAQPNDVRRLDQVVTRIGDRWHCKIYDRAVRASSLVDHHHDHLKQLDALLEAVAAAPKPDSARRADDRRRKRQEALDRSVALGEDPFLVAIENVDPITNHRSRTRRLRRPADETLARVRELHGRGMIVAAIADETKLSEDYIRRLIARIDRAECSK